MSSFYCKANNFKILIDYVNDGIFDCDDGSDEFSTHLYNMGEFVCNSELGKDGYFNFAIFIVERHVG